MKRTTVYLAFSAFAWASILTSCSFLQKGEFADRKYYNFPRSKHAVEQAASVKPERKKVIAPAAILDEKKQTEPIVSAAVNGKEILLAGKKSSRKISPPVAVNAVEESNRLNMPVIHFKKADIRKAAKKNSEYFNASDAGMMMFLAVIASIFIPPLGIYIKDHRTHKWFWITMLLWALAILGLGFSGAEFIYTGLSGLFWLTAVVIALLVVFDIL